MSKKIPEIMTDKQAEKIIENDLSDLDFSQFRPVQFEYKPKNRQVNLRMSEELLAAVKIKAENEGMSYQRYIRQAVENSL